MRSADCGFQHRLRRWFLRNLLKPADCRRRSEPESVGSGSLLCAALSNPRPTLARPPIGNRFAPFRDAESDGHRHQNKTPIEFKAGQTQRHDAEVIVLRRDLKTKCAFQNDENLSITLLSSVGDKKSLIIFRLENIE
jgi:hypothetical protein